MENKVVNLKVNTTLGNTNKEFSNLKKGLDDSKKSANELNNTVNETGKKGNVFSKLTSGLSGLIPGFKGAESAGQGVLKTMWAIVANPIGAIIAGIVLALTALYKAFASTKAGGEKIEQLMSGLGAVIDVLRDRVLKAGSAIAKFLTGDFKGAFKEAKEAASGMGAEMEKEFRQAANAKKYLQEVDDALRSLSVSRAKLNRDLAKSKEIITDENASYAEKKKAINEVKIAEEKQTQAELKNAQKKLNAIKLANKLSDTNKDNLDKQAAAEAELYALQEKSATDRRAIRKTELRADKEEQARLKSIQDERNAKAKDDNEKARVRAKEKYDLEKTLIDEIVKNEKLSFEEKRKNVNDDRIISKADKDKYLKEIELQENKSIEEHNKSIAELNKKYDDERLNREADTAIKKEQLDYDRQLAEIEKITINELEKQTLIEKLDTEHKARLDIIAKADADKKLADEKILSDKLKALEEEKIRVKLKSLNDIQTIFGAESKIGKAALIAKQLLMAKELVLEVSKTISFATQSAARSTIAVVEGSAQTAKVGFPQNIPLLIGYAAQAAGIYSAIRGALKSAKTSATISSLPSVSSTQTTPVERERTAPQFNVVGTSNTSQLAQSIGQKDATPIKAYVVSNDVSTQQGLDRAIVKTATL